MDIISRSLATERGLRVYYLGPESPCKWGHDSPRYTINAACIACMQKHRPRLNPHSKDKVPYQPVRPLWRTKRHTDATLKELYAYLQSCIDAYEAARFLPVCKDCNGTRYVPMLPGEGGVPGQWKLCMTCDVPEPSTADVPTGTTP
jgi:hypothetical protein